MFDSPISRCEVMHEMVLTDQTQAECAREHQCPAGQACPLANCFYAVSGITMANCAAAPIATGGKHPRH